MDSSLPAILHSDVAAFLSKEEWLSDLLYTHGSPLHIIFPGIMQDRLRSFRQALIANGFELGKIYFAAKANKANSFLATVAALEEGADVSSPQEFIAALSMGIPGGHISVSGPTKPKGLIALALKHDAMVAVDEPSEIALIKQIHKNLGAKTSLRVCLRLSSSPQSRFGHTAKEVNLVMQRISRAPATFRLEGFSFHCNGYATDDRIRMIKVACSYVAHARSLGLHPTRVNIGGGFAVQYANPDTWSEERATKRDFIGSKPPEFIYPYASQAASFTQLIDILKAAKRIIRKHGQNVTIDIEPGRALLDQAGVTLFRVLGTRRVAHRGLIVVEGNMNHLSESWFKSEFLIDPLLISQRSSVISSFAAAIAGNTCLESDYLARRFITFPAQPVPNDIIAYINTAGYQMDSNESEFHRLPIPRKLAATVGKDGWKHIDDGRMQFTDILERIQL